MLKVLDAVELQKSLPMSAAIQAMREAFTQHALGAYQMPLRTATPVSDQAATLLAMPAYVKEPASLGIKVLAIFPNNTKQATINGLVVMFDAKTGEPAALINGAALTAIRTGATSGLATDLLANQNATHLAIIGTGAQAYTQVEAVCCVRNIKSLAIYSRNEKNAEKFAEKCGFKGEIKINDGIAAADVICTATPSTSPILNKSQVKPGVHINAIGSHTPQMKEISNDLLAVAKVYVDERAASMAEAGEIIDAISAGLMSDDGLIELGKVILVPGLGRQNANDITIFKSVGLAIQDICAANAALKNDEMGKRISV